MIKLIAMIVFFIVAAILVFGSFFTLGENQDAVVTTFGVPSAVTESGLHFKIPLIQDVQKVTTSTQGMSIGYDINTEETIENESLMITKDFNFVNVDFYLEYQVVDPLQYLYAAEDPILMMKTLAMSYIRDTVGSYNIDEILTTGKAQIQTEIKDKLIARMEEEKVGIAIRSVTIQDAEPPTAEVSAAFKAVEDAKQKAEETINIANKYKSEKVPAAEAEANALIQSAEAQKQSRIKEAEGQVARFSATYQEYVKFPEVTKSRMYFEAMEELLPNITVIIKDDNGQVLNITGGNKVLQTMGQGAGTNVGNE